MIVTRSAGVAPRAVPRERPGGGAPRWVPAATSDGSLTRELPSPPGLLVHGFIAVRPW